MKLVTWRNATLVLAVICGVQRYAACTHRSATAHETSSSSTPESSPRESHPFSTPAPDPALPATPAKPPSFHGVKIPPMIARFLPQPGEPLRAYRDRMLPLAELVMAPQRARVARIRDKLALAPAQRAELDTAVTETATAIENRILAGLANGEIDPHSLTPMGGIAVARDVLDTIDRGNTRFQSTLDAEQRASLGPLHFDFADYLVFSARWEDVLHVLD